MAQTHAAWGTATCRKTHETGSCEIGIYHSELLFPFHSRSSRLFCPLLPSFEGRHLRLFHHFSLCSFSHIDNPLLFRPSVGPCLFHIFYPLYYTSRCARLLSYMLSIHNVPNPIAHLAFPYIICTLTCDLNVYRRGTFNPFISSRGTEVPMMMMVMVMVMIYGRAFSWATRSDMTRAVGN